MLECASRARGASDEQGSARRWQMDPLLKAQEETEPGHQALAVKLKNTRSFGQVVASEGFIIQVRGYNEVPFTPDQVMSVEMNHRHWNFWQFERARKCNW